MLRKSLGVKKRYGADVELPAFYKLKPETMTKENVTLEKTEKKPEISGRTVVYTCITGGYEKLVAPVKTPGFDYICFTDTPEMAPNGWEIRPMPEGLEGLTKAKQQRMVKILPHKYLHDYDISIYVDGSIKIKKDLREFLKTFIYSGYSIFIPTHPTRSCLYKECEVVKKIKKDTTDLPDKQIKKYKEEGYPENNGLTQNNIIIRWHNDEDCKKVMEAWAEEVREFSHRDQLSFCYALWKTKAKCFKALDKKTCNSDYFYWDNTHGKQVRTVKKK